MLSVARSLKLHTTTDVGVTNVANAASRRCGCTLTFAQLFSDFVTMLAVSNTGVNNDPRYNLQPFSLRQTYVSPLTGTSLTLSGPATVGTLTPGQTATITSMFRGGFAFFSFDNFSPNGSRYFVLTALSAFDVEPCVDQLYRLKHQLISDGHDTPMTAKAAKPCAHSQCFRG